MIKAKLWVLAQTQQFVADRIQLLIKDVPSPLLQRAYQSAQSSAANLLLYSEQEEKGGSLQ